MTMAATLKMAQLSLPHLSLSLPSMVLDLHAPGLPSGSDVAPDEASSFEARLLAASSRHDEMAPAPADLPTGQATAHAPGKPIPRVMAAFRAKPVASMAGEAAEHAGEAAARPLVPERLLPARGHMDSAPRQAEQPVAPPGVEENHRVPVTAPAALPAPALPPLAPIAPVPPFNAQPVTPAPSPPPAVPSLPALRLQPGTAKAELPGGTARQTAPIAPAAMAIELAENGLQNPSIRPPSARQSEQIVAMAADPAPAPTPASALASSSASAWTSAQNLLVETPLSTGPVNISILDISPSRGAEPDVAARLLDLSGEDWAARLSDQLLAAPRNDRELSFRLTPQHLGMLEIGLTETARGMIVELQPSGQEAAQIIARDEPRLIEELRQRGVPVAEVLLRNGAGDDSRNPRNGANPAPHAPLTMNDPHGQEDQDQQQGRNRGRLA